MDSCQHGDAIVCHNWSCPLCESQEEARELAQEVKDLEERVEELEAELKEATDA